MRSNPLLCGASRGLFRPGRPGGFAVQRSARPRPERSSRISGKREEQVGMEYTPQTQSSATLMAGEGLSIRRFFTTPGRHPFDRVEWELRDARIGHGDKVSFEQPDVEFPKT